jgi:hypothetical protein
MIFSGGGWCPFGAIGHTTPLHQASIFLTSGIIAQVILSNLPLASK